VGRKGDLLQFDAIGSRKKKLLGGIRYSLWLSDHAPWDCTNCTTKQRKLRNCHNRAGYEDTILIGAQEWGSIPASRKHALKLDDADGKAPLKFMACPVSTTTPHTWELIRLVNRCTGGEGTDLQHLPWPGLITDQPPGFLEAVDMMRGERFAYQKKQMAKRDKK